MKRLLLVAAIFAGLSASAFGQSSPPLRVREIDLSPSVYGVTTLVFSNGSVTCTGKVCTVTTGGGGGTTINATDGVVPYRSGATTFLDSSLSMSSGRLISTATLTSSGVLPYLRVITPVDTGQTADAEFPGIVFGGNASGATVTRTGADGTTLATQREYIFTAPTYAFAGATTVTNAATVAIAAAPVAGANATIANPFALWVQGGQSRFDTTNGASNPLLVTTASFAAYTALEITSGGDSRLRLGRSGDKAYISGTSTGLALNAPASGLSLDLQTNTISRLVLPGRRTVATNNVALALFEIALPTLKSTNVVVRYSVHAVNATDVQVRSGIVRISAVNKAAAYTSESAIVNEAASVSTGTLTATWSITNGSDKVTINITPNSSITPTTYYVTFSVSNESEQAVTIL